MLGPISATSPVFRTVQLDRKMPRTGGDTNAEAVRLGPGALLDRDVLSQLSRLRPISLASRLVFDYGLILECYREIDG